MQIVIGIGAMLAMSVCGILAGQNIHDGNYGLAGLMVACILINLHTLHSAMR